MTAGLVIAIFGPTASGKSAVAEALATRTAGVVISADAMQAYAGLPILTNQSDFPTRLVGIWPLSSEGSVGLYAPLAHEAIDLTLAARGLPIVVGGTGLYLRAALTELDVPPPARPGARRRLEELYDALGPERAHKVLEERDSRAAGRVHPNDRRRVVRALELAESGMSLRPSEDRLWAATTRHPTMLVGLDLPRPELARRIERRTRSMFESGIAVEVSRAADGEVSATARQIIGFREVRSLPPGEAEAAIVRRTLQYATYQRKWLRRLPADLTLDARRAPGELAEEILTSARARCPEGDRRSAQ